MIQSRYHEILKCLFCIKTQIQHSEMVCPSLLWKIGRCIFFLFCKYPHFSPKFPFIHSYVSDYRKQKKYFAELRKNRVDLRNASTQASHGVPDPIPKNSYSFTTHVIVMAQALASLLRVVHFVVQSFGSPEAVSVVELQEVYSFARVCVRSSVYLESKVLTQLGPQPGTHKSFQSLK